MTPYSETQVLEGSCEYNVDTDKLRAWWKREMGNAERKKE